MGRKRDKGFDAPSKRRTILQIDQKTSLKSEHKDSPSHGAAAQPQKVHNPLGLLANYGDSDDEGLDEDAPTPPRQTKGGFIGVDGTKPKNEMDEKVADFLAEIDALDPDTPEHSSEPADTVDTNDSSEAVTATATAAATSVATTADVEEPAAAAAAVPAAPHDNGGWQELLDENTNCIYYWNTVSNEVTWEMPPGFQPIDAVVEQAPEQPPSQPSSGIATPTQLEEPVAEAEEAPPPKPVKEEPKKTSEPKNAEKEETSVKEEEVTKKVTAKVPAKAPVLDMFADEVDEVKDTKKTLGKKGAKKMPIYGTLKVDYDVDSEEEESKPEPEPEPEPPKPKGKKLGSYSMFVKGDTMPGSKEKKKKSSKKSAVETVVLAHLDITEDGDAEESRINGASDAGSLTSIDKVEDDDDDVVEMDMGDDIDIDQQLELALERKKAELAQLEELEKGSSSSPAQKRKISSPLDVYDEKGEVNLLSFKKKRLENMKGQKQVATCDQGTQCDELLEKMAVDHEKFKSLKKIKEEADLKKELSDLGSTLTSKLEFLGQSRKGLSKLQVLLIEIETRVLDWREGALDGKHLLRKLQIADWELQRYESEAVPRGWTCTWNRTHKQYYYTSSVTGESQWDYPVEAFQEPDRKEQSMDEKESSAMFNRASSQDDSEAIARGSTAMLHGSVTTGQLSIQGIAKLQPLINPLPAINTIAPPPPAVPSPEPPPPPLPDDAPPLPDDPPPPGTGPDLPPLPPSPPPPPPSPPAPEDSEDEDDSEGPSSRPMTPPPLPPAPFTTAAPTHYGIPPPPPPESDGTVIGKPQLLYTNAPSAGATISRPPEVAGIDGMPVGDYGGAPVTYGSQPTVFGEPTAGGTPTSQPAAVKKKTKRAKKSSAVKKKMPLSLVEKWKQIQEAQAKEEEEKRRKEEEEEMVLDPSVITQRRIEEWKKQQMEAGKAGYNPNFETIKGDWRERLKRKK